MNPYHQNNERSEYWQSRKREDFKSALKNIQDYLEIIRDQEADDTTIATNRHNAPQSLLQKANAASVRQEGYRPIER